MIVNTVYLTRNQSIVNHFLILGYWLFWIGLYFLFKHYNVNHTVKQWINQTIFDR